jgi:phage baseplate assembly protein gpV
MTIKIEESDGTIRELTSEELELLEQEKIEQAAIEFKETRTYAYPSIGDQLDMLYWDGVNGTTVWADTIAQIKSENPKP